MDNGRRNELIMEVTDVLRNIVLVSNNPTIVETKMYEYMKLQLKDKIELGKLKLAISQPSSMATLDTSELYLVVRNINRYCERENYKFKIELESYFSEDERKLANYMRLSDMAGKELQLKAMQKGSENKPEWIGIMSYEEIVDASRRGLLKYNMSTQRVANVFISNGKVNYIPDIDENTVDKIANAILDGRFEPNTITLNILKTADMPYYNAFDEGYLLSVDAEDNEIDIIDGMHRVKGIVKAWQIREKQIVDQEEDKQISGTMAVCVKNISEEQARTFIHQESLANKQANSTKLLYGPDSQMSQFLSRLNVEGGSVAKNPFYGKISSYVNKDVVISTAFVARFMDDMGVATTLNSAIKKESVLRQTAANLVSFANVVFEELREREDYKKNRKIFENQCFLVGLMTYFVYYMEHHARAFDLSEESKEEFFDRIKSVSPKELEFDYPLIGKQKNTVRRIYR